MDCGCIEPVVEGMEPLFRESKPPRIFQDVVDQIEALRVLEQKGLIEIKLGVGGGSVVKSVTAEQVTESLDLLIRSQKISLTQLAEFREGVEGEVVAIAARKADGNDYRHLTRLLEKAKAGVDRGPSKLDEFLRADKDLHLAFAFITGNPLFISVLQTIHNNIYRYFERYLRMKDREMMENYRDLEAIVAAVQRGDSDISRQLAVQHVRRFYEYMLPETNEQKRVTAL